MELGSFLADFRAAIIVLSKVGEGMEHTLDQPRVLIGRGPGVDLALDEPSLARVHAALEFHGGGYGLRLARSGVELWDTATELEDGDRFQLGGVTFGYVCDPRKPPPR
jgi:pSer/pThr/pTyr-binding forkhead associated (FHA) protein